MSRAQLPWELPASLTPRRLLLIAVGLGTAALAVPSVYWINLVREVLRGEMAAMVVLAISTAILSVLLTNLATRKPTRSLLWFLLGGPVAGVINAGISLAGASLVTKPANGVLESIFIFVFGMVFASFCSVPLGFAYGIGLSIADMPLRRMPAPSQERLDRTAIWLGGWLIVVGAIAACLSIDVPFVPLWIIPIGAGAMLMLVGLARREVRRSFLSRVRQGLEPQWAIVEGGRDPELGLIPFEMRLYELGEGMLVHLGVSNQGPYRDGLKGVPVAIVDLGPAEPSLFNKLLKSRSKKGLRLLHAIGATGAKMLLASLSALMVLMLVVGLLSVAAAIVPSLDLAW